MVGIININKEICDDQNGRSNHQAEGKQSASYLKNIYKGKHLMETSAISTSASNQYYVYIYLDPRKPGNYSYTDSETGEAFKFDYEPFYVGMGKGDRWKHHLRKSSRRGNRYKENPFKSNKINKIINETGNNPIILKIKEYLNKNNALLLEIKLIKLIGRYNKNKGTLTNLTDGGEGGIGIIGKIVSEETRKKISEAQKGEKSAWWGRKHTKEELEKISKGNKNKILTKEHREKIGKSSKGRKWPITSRKNKSINTIGENNSFYGKHHSLESKQKQMDKMYKYDYILSNHIDYRTLDPSEKGRIRALFTFYKSNEIIYRKIKIIRKLRNICQN